MGCKVWVRSSHIALHLRVCSTMLGIGDEEAYKSNDWSIKENTSFRIGVLEYTILRYVVEHGLKQFTLGELARDLKVDVRRVFDALTRLRSRNIVARVERGLYRLLIRLLISIEGLAELLTKAIIQGPGVRGGVKESDDTRPYLTSISNIS